MTKAEQVAAGDAARAEHRRPRPLPARSMSAPDTRANAARSLATDCSATSCGSSQRAGHKVDDLGAGRVDAGVAQGPQDPLPPGMTPPAADDHPPGPEGTHGRGQA